jgi:hypothetical protein
MQLQSSNPLNSSYKQEWNNPLLKCQHLQNKILFTCEKVVKKMFGRGDLQPNSDSKSQKTLKSLSFNFVKGEEWGWHEKPLHWILPALNSRPVAQETSEL